MNNVYLVIIAGGSGTRFWPKSTSRRPKQLLSFGGGQGADSLLVQTLNRFDGVAQNRPENRMIITTELLKGPMSEQVGGKGVTILAEPQGRNTAPCVYWGARAIAEKDPKGIMMVMPADHYIPRKEKFAETVRKAIDWARTHDDLVTLGVKPSRPETGYGYLRIGAALQGECRKVDAFVEKPNLQKAQEFLAAGNYLWNGGMFVWRAEVILKAFDEFMPEMKRAWDSAHGAVEKAYPQMTATSIDYGVMERATNVVSFPLDCGWDDLGSWTSLEGVAEVLNARKEGGVVTGGELLAIESSGNIVDAPGKLVAILGVNDLIVVEAGNSILVANKSQAQDIKKIVDRLKQVRPELV